MKDRVKKVHARYMYFIRCYCIDKNMKTIYYCCNKVIEQHFN